MSKIFVKAIGSFMYTTKGGDCCIRISDTEAISLCGLAESIEEIQCMLSVIYHAKMQIAKDKTSKEE